MGSAETTGDPLFDFDRIIDRAGTNAIAVDGYDKYLFDEDEPDVVIADDAGEVLALWVADMAFASAPPAIDAMAERLRHPIFGYTVMIEDHLFDAFSGWCRRHYGWEPKSDHFLPAPGIVPALYDLVDYVLEPGEKALTLTPAYEPFERAATAHGRGFVTSGLVESADARYDIDFADLDTKLSDPSVGLFFLCHPHNPTGRVWTEYELRTMAELCFDHGVMIVSDEIHCDLLRTGLVHTPLARLYPESDQIITCMSSSKTFNLAGLGMAHVIIPHEGIRAIWSDRKFPVVNPLSAAAATGVFRNGDGWLAQLKTYLDANFDLVRDVLARELPGAGFRVPDATYLAWVDLRSFFEPGVDLTRFFAERCALLVEGGHKFVDHAEGHVRINLACPRAMIEDALARLVPAVQQLQPA